MIPSYLPPVTPRGCRVPWGVYGAHEAAHDARRGLRGRPARRGCRLRAERTGPDGRAGGAPAGGARADRRGGQGPVGPERVPRGAGP
eukprot:1938246-Rhodomonas_salina.1